MKVAALACLTILTACAAAPDHVYLVRCPPLVAYPPALQDRAADELALLPPGAATLQMIADYATLRAKCRAIENVGGLQFSG